MNEQGCVRNHGIGIIIFSPGKIGIVIGRLDLIRYQMIWMGGLYGVILGYSSRIMNLEMLEKVLEVIVRDLRSLFMGKLALSKETSVEVIPVGDRMRKNEKLGLKPELGIYWILCCFYNYYNDFNSRKVIRTLLKPCIELLGVVLDRLMRRGGPNIEMLDFIELHDIHAPLTSRLRGYLEGILSKSCEGGGLKELSKTIIQDPEVSLIRVQDTLRVMENKIKEYRIDQLSGDLEIHGVLGSIGTNLIIDSNISEVPVIIHLDDLIGREII